MSDSSEDEDLSRFQDVVDTSFLQSIKTVEDRARQVPNPNSERYLHIASHYNDVKVPVELQKKIGAKISAILDKTIEYVDISREKPIKVEIKGGVKLFSNSKGFLSHKEESDNYTDKHNIQSKKLKQIPLKRKFECEVETIGEKEKLNSVALSGEYILSGRETKCWKSRRKEKLYKYKSKDKDMVLIAIE